MLIILTSNIVICKHLSSQALHRHSKSRPTQGSEGSWETCDFSGVHVYRSSNLLLIRHLPHLNKNIPESKNAGEACSVSRGKPENLFSYW